MSCCTKTYNLGCFNNCSIIAVGLCENSGTYNGIFTYGNISTTITVTAIENEPFLFDLSLLNENATFSLAIYDENENQITLNIDSVGYDCFKVKTQVDSVKVTQGTIIGCSPMCKEIYDPNDENTAVLFTVAVDGTTITGDGTVGNPLIAIGGGGGGGIESIVAGDNITIDNTDPLNPIVNATFDYSLFPKGYEFISESRDFLPTDEGKLLILETGVTISMPSEFPFLSNQILGVFPLDSNCYYQDKSGSTVQIFGINNQPNEVVVLLSEPDFNSLLPISSSVIEGKTMLKYLYDKSQNAIPLSGTEVSNPVTGDIEVFNGFDLKTPNASANEFHSLYMDDGGIQLKYNNSSVANSFIAEDDGFSITSDNASFRGFKGDADYSAAYQVNDYTQKIYVDSLATSKQDALVSGTNIKTINGSSILGSGDMTVGGQVDILQIQMFI